MTLSEAATRVLEAAIEIESEKGRGSGYQELANRAERAISAVQRQVGILLREGYLRRDEGSKVYFLRAVRNPDGSSYERPASVALTARASISAEASLDRHPAFVPSEIIGSISAGPPREAIEYTDVVMLPDLDEIDGGVKCWIRGNSMYGAPHWLADGDVAVFRKDIEPRNGDIVIARIDDEVTIKRYRKRGDTVYLEPLNPDFQPIVLRKRELARLHLEGKVISVIHRLE